MGAVLFWFWTFGIPKSHAVSSLLYPLDRQCLYITYNHIQAQSIYNDLKFYMEDDVMLLPPRDIVLYDVAALARMCRASGLRF